MRNYSVRNIQQVDTVNNNNSTEERGGGTLVKHLMEMSMELGLTWLKLFYLWAFEFGKLLS